jgi:hypothetical protein
MVKLIWLSDKLFHSTGVLAKNEFLICSVFNMFDFTTRIRVQWWNNLAVAGMLG